MDWSRAKTIFIVIFLAVNIFLFVNILSFKMGEGISRETISDAEQILKTRGVTLECEIPDRVIDDISLKYDSTELDKLKITGKLLGEQRNENSCSIGSKTLNFDGNHAFTYLDATPQDRLNTLNRSEAEKYIKNFMKDTGVPVSSFITDAYSSNNDGSISIKLIQKYKDILIFNNTVEATLAKTGIIGLKCRYREIREGKDDKNVLPAYLVLLTNFEENNNSIITGMDIGFGEYHDGDVKHGYLWRVKMSDGKVMYFKAIDGKPITM